MTEFVAYLLGGVPQGCVFALVAVGLVLIYKTTGVFNLAFGAQAFLSAAIFYKTVSDWGWPTWAGFVLSVLVVAPLFGWFLDAAIFRRLRTAPWQVKLVSALGFVIAIPEIVKLSADDFPDRLASLLRPLPIFLGPTPPFNPPGIVPEGTRRVDSIGGIDISAYAIERNDIATIVITFAVVVGLALLFRSTAIGLQMRAVVESPRMVELAGVDADRVSTVAWMLSSALAGLAGVLISPLWATVDGNNFTILIVTAIAAAAFGRLSSIPLTLAGGLVLGVSISLFAGYGDQIFERFIDDRGTVQTLVGGIRPAIPFLLLFGLLVFSPALRGRRELTDPLSGVDPPPPALAVTHLDPGMRRLSLVTRYGFIAFVFAFVFWSPSFPFRGQQLLGWRGETWVVLITQVIVFAVVLLSVTAFTGLSGQISLAAATFMGIGAYTVGNLASSAGVDVMVGLVVAAVVAGAAGALLAVPALRLGGIFLTLATLAFALLFSSVVFPLDGVSGGTTLIGAPRPAFAASDQVFFVLAFAVFALAAYVVIRVRDGTTGGFLAALRGSEVAAASVGINGTVARIVLFTVSAMLAGVGGGLYGMSLEGAPIQTTEFEALFSVVFVVLVLNAAGRTVDGAVNAAFGFIVFLAFINEQLGIPRGVGIILFGFGALTYARHPEGVAEWQKRLSIQRIQERRAMARHEKVLKADRRLPGPVRSSGLVVVLSVLTLGLATVYFVYRWHREVRVERGQGLGGAYGLLVFLPLRILGTVLLLAQLTDPSRSSYFRFGDAPLDWVVLLLVVACWVPLNVTAFVLPAEIASMCRERGIESGIRWSAGIPVVLSGAVYLLLASERASYFGTFVLIGLGVAAWLSWIGGVQQALNAYWIHRAAEEAPGEGAAPVVEPGTGGPGAVAPATVAAGEPPPEAAT